MELRVFRVDFWETVYVRSTRFHAVLKLLSIKRLFACFPDLTSLHSLMIRVAKAVSQEMKTLGSETFQ